MYCIYSIVTESGFKVFAEATITLTRSANQHDTTASKEQSGAHITRLLSFNSNGTRLKYYFIWHFELSLYNIYIHYLFQQYLGLTSCQFFLQRDRWLLVFHTWNYLHSYQYTILSTGSFGMLSTQDDFGDKMRSALVRVATSWSRIMLCAFDCSIGSPPDWKKRSVSRILV